MAHGKIRVNTLTYDTGSGDVDVAVSTIPDATALNAKANKADAALTGTPTAPTAASGTNTTQIATTAFVAAAVPTVDPDTAVTDAVQIFTKAQRGDIIDVTGTSPQIDLNAGNNFRFTTSGDWGSNMTLANLASAAEGQTGSIFIVYGGAHTGGFPTTMKFVGGAAGLGALSSASPKIDRIDYIVLNSTTVTCTLTKDYIA
jgi:hypothetical protein